MVAVPFDTAVTVPLLSTVATDVSDDDHVTVVSSALSGFTVAVSFLVMPGESVSVLSLSVTRSTATGSGSLLHPMTSASAHAAAMQAACHVCFFMYFSLSAGADVFFSA